RSRMEQVVKLGMLAYLAAGTGMMLASSLRDQTVVSLSDSAVTAIALVASVAVASIVCWTFVPADPAAAPLLAARGGRSARLPPQLMGFVAQASSPPP